MNRGSPNTRLCGIVTQTTKILNYANIITAVVKLQVHFSDKFQLKNTHSVKRLTTVLRVWFLTGQTSSSVVNIKIHTDELMHFYSQCKNNAVDTTI